LTGVKVGVRGGSSRDSAGTDAGRAHPRAPRHGICWHINPDTGKCTKQMPIDASLVTIGDWRRAHAVGASVFGRISARLRARAAPVRKIGEHAPHVVCGAGRSGT